MVIILLLLGLSITGFAQKILVVENSATLKNFKYYPGEEIILKVKQLDNKLADEIETMDDTCLVLAVNGVVRLDDIRAIYKENWFVQIVRGFSLLAGVAYFGIDSFNRLINNDSPVILAETAIISGGLVAFSFALAPLHYRKYSTKKKWRLRTIDFNDVWVD